MKSFQPPILNQKAAFSTTKVGVNKLHLRRIYCICCLISEMQGRIWTSLVTEDVIVNLSPMFKRLEDGVDLGHE